MSIKNKLKRNRAKINLKLGRSPYLAFGLTLMASAAAWPASATTGTTSVFPIFIYSTLFFLNKITGGLDEKRIVEQALPKYKDPFKNAIGKLLYYYCERGEFYWKNLDQKDYRVIRDCYLKSKLGEGKDPKEKNNIFPSDQYGEWTADVLFPLALEIIGADALKEILEEFPRDTLYNSIWRNNQEVFSYLAELVEIREESERIVEGRLKKNMEFRYRCPDIKIVKYLLDETTNLKKPEIWRGFLIARASTWSENQEEILKLLQVTDDKNKIKNALKPGNNKGANKI